MLDLCLEGRVLALVVFEGDGLNIAQIFVQSPTGGMVELVII